MLRGLRKKINGEELFDSYKKAEAERNIGAQAVYFEEMMHWCFREKDISPSIVESVQAVGSGAEGVRELVRILQYWIPSIPNFVNIDSAIVGSDGKVWCFQFTVSKSHSYKKHCLRLGFLSLIQVPIQEEEVKIIFVVPSGTPFTEPDTGNEVATATAVIDCSSLATVLKSTIRVASQITDPTGEQ
jgi:hypothetical protein